MKQKSKLILGFIIFIIGLTVFFCLIPIDGFLRVLIGNDSISISLGLSVSIICWIISLILIAKNEFKVFNNKNRNNYKFKVYSEFISSIVLGLSSIVAIVISIGWYNSKILILSIIISIVCCIGFIYYLNKVKELINTKKKYKGVDFIPKTFYELILNDHYKNKIRSKLKKNIKECSIKSDYDEQFKKININFKSDNYNIEIVVGKKEIYYFITLNDDVESSIYNIISHQQSSEYSKEEIEEFIYSDEATKIPFNRYDNDHSYVILSDYVNNLIEKTTGLIEFNNKYKRDSQMR